MNAPAEVESYLEQLRNVEPSVTWKVRCFHYEEREFWNWCKGLVGRMVLERYRASGGEGGNNKSDNVKSTIASSSSEGFVGAPPSWMARKVVTHQAKGTYKFGSWEDHTLASLWKRSQSFSSSTSSHHEAPFSKLTLSKLLVLKDKNTREDYFAQQAAFVMLEGRKDVHAEFATSIEVEGFRPKLLAVRPVRHATNISAALFRQHVYVLFTLLGLSLPYRMWFAKHCDEIRVTVVKETSTAENENEKEGEMTTEGKSSWFRGKWGRGSSSSKADISRERAQELFRSRMRSFSLYEEEDPSPVLVDQTETNQSATLEIENVPQVESSAESRKEESLVLDESRRDDEVGNNDETTTHDDGQASTSVANNLVTESATTENIDFPNAAAATTHNMPLDSSLSTESTPDPPTMLTDGADEAR